MALVKGKGGKGGGKNGGIFCYNCGKTGHMAKDFWAPPKGNGKGDIQRDIGSQNTLRAHSLVRDIINMERITISREKEHTEKVDPGGVAGYAEGITMLVIARMRIKEKAAERESTE